eukprot:955857_1
MYYGLSNMAKVTGFLALASIVQGKHGNGWGAGKNFPDPPDCQRTGGIMTAVVITFFCLLAVVLLVLVLWAARAMHRRELAARDSQIAGLTEQLNPQLPEDETGVTEDAVEKARVAEELNVELRTQIEGLEIERDESNESAQTAKSRVTELEGNVERLTTLEQSLNTEIAALTSASKEATRRSAEALTTATARADDLAGQLAGLETARAHSESEVSSITDSLEALQQRFNVKVHDLEQLTTAAVVTAHQDQHRIVELEAAATLLNNQIRDLEAASAQSDERAQRAEWRVTELGEDVARLTALEESQRAEIDTLTSASAGFSDQLQAATLAASQSAGSLSAKELLLRTKENELAQLREVAQTAEQNAVERERSLRADLATLRTESAETLAARVEELEKAKVDAVQRVQEELDAAESQVEVLTQAQTAASANATQRTEEFEAARVQHESAEQLLRAQIETLNTEKENAVQSAEVTATEHEARVEQLQADCATATERVRELETAALNHAQELEDAALNHDEELVTARALAQEELQRLQDQINAPTDASATDVSQAQRIAELETTLAVKRDELSEKTDHITYLENLRDEQEGEYEALKRDLNDEHEKAKKEYMAEMDEQRALILTLGQEKDELLEEGEEQEIEIERLQAKLRESADQESVLQVQNEGFRTEIQKYKSQIEKLRTSLEEAGQEVERQHERIGEIRAQKELLEATVEKLKAEKAKALINVETEIHSRDAQIQEMKEQNDRIRHQLENSESNEEQTRSRLQATIDKLAREKEHLRQALAASPSQSSLRQLTTALSPSSHEASQSGQDRRD